MKIRAILLCLLAGVFLFSGWKVWGLLKEYDLGATTYGGLADRYATVLDPSQLLQHAASEGAELLDGAVGSEHAPVTVDFDALLQTCPDVVGWIYSPETPIHYPIVQSSDNDYYLRRLLDGTYNRNGSIFLDYRCAGDFSDPHSIIYGHNMRNDAMFGTLEGYKSQEYYDAHPVLYLLTPGQDYRVDLIGGYTTSGADTDSYRLAVTWQEQEALAARFRQRSTFLSDVEVSEGERLLMLSTCVYDYSDARYVLLGVLREL